jgi:hypothetical protein
MKLERACVYHLFHLFPSSFLTRQQHPL